MGFFDAPAPSPPPLPPLPPPWLFPPDNVLGAFVPLRTVLIRSSSLLVVAERFVAYPTGFEFTVRVQAREAMITEPMAADAPPPTTGEPDGGAFRVGVVLPDGSRASSQSRPALEDEPNAPVVSAYRGGGDGNERHQRCWVWPLPSDGPVRLVVEWPAARVKETWGELDGAAIHTAAERSELLWER